MLFILILKKPSIRSLTGDFLASSARMALMVLLLTGLDVFCVTEGRVGINSIFSDWTAVSSGFPLRNSPKTNFICDLYQ